MSYIIRPCVYADEKQQHVVTPADPADAQFWGVYKQRQIDNSRTLVDDNVCDFATEQEAQEYADFKNGKLDNGWDTETVEVAMCLWEGVLDSIDNTRIEPVTAAERYVAADQSLAWLRMAVLEKAKAVEAVWRDLDGRFDDSFDWEFVPMLLAELDADLGNDFHVSDERIREAGLAVLAKWEAGQTA